MMPATSVADFQFKASPMDSRVSIVIPTYNRAALLGRAVRSALSECIPGDEIIVVDDGSTDDSGAVLRGFGAAIRVLRLPNGGAGKARNAGVLAAKNDLVAFLDSDDEWFPGKLTLQRALLQARPDVIFCFSDFSNNSREGHITRNFLRFWHNDPRNWDEILGPGTPYSLIVTGAAGSDFKVHIGDLSLAEMRSAYVFTSSMVARRSVGDALHFAEDVGTFEDLECFGRLALSGKAAYLDCETVWQHGHTGPRLTGAATLVKANSRLMILERVWGTNQKFLASYRREFEAAVDETRRLKIRALLNFGESGSARAELAKLYGPAPMTDRVASALPPWLLRLGLQLSGKRGTGASLNTGW
jgi:glycosyltransferase involved in cell wall biosynthesis